MKMIIWLSNYMQIYFYHPSIDFLTQNFKYWSALADRNSDLTASSRIYITKESSCLYLHSANEKWGL